jgi:(1->4)-alpha-D-glucan 1-alpha-D-glucosylmutase
MIPTATYRIQFHAGFTFADAAKVAPYLAHLGISHLYASPIATARAGSMHGYDVVDPTTINPALGGEAGFRALVAELRRRGMGVILDIVPNHVAVGGADNAWWLDVLESGPASAYASYFDIDWSPGDPALEGKLLAPFLGAPYAEALASGDIVLELDPDTHCLAVTAYGVHRFPIRSEDYASVLAAAEAKDLWDIKPRLLRSRFDGRDAAGRARLHDLLERQHYRLAWWRTAGDQINWRRFFDISELAGLRVEDEAVFEAVHALPLRLYAEGLIDGVRVDHIDGLADPAAYGRRLRRRLEEAGGGRPEALAGPAYVVVEKILAQGETLAGHWAVDGTTGYDFMNAVSALLHDPKGAEPLGSLWAEISGRSPEFEDEAAAARVEILDRAFAAQRAAAAAAFEALARSDLTTRDLTRCSFTRAINAVVAAFPNYRTYGTGDAAPASDAPVREGVLRMALAAVGPIDAPAVAFILSALAGEAGGDPDLRRDAVRRLQQLTAPVTAKAVEDTAFYRYIRLLSRNDVGFDPERLGAAPEAFHAWVVAQSAFPNAQLATATHDHKRGEDVRARLAVLSEIPQVWRDEAMAWLAAMPGEIAPADAYQMLQGVVGAWPPALQPDDAEGLEAFGERINGWMEKALREAKLRSSWVAPDGDYEAACRKALDAVLRPDGLARSIAAFVSRIAPAAAAKSLVQTGLKLTAPGVPDIYQGTELWDFSLVDPDNRRPVDYDLLAAVQREEAPEGAPDDRVGAVKARLVRRLLRLRVDRPRLFVGRNYAPITLVGARAADAIAFRREADGAALLVCAAVRGAEACIARGLAGPGAEWWGDTALQLGGERTLSAADLMGEDAFGWRLLS